MIIPLVAFTTLVVALITPVTALACSVYAVVASVTALAGLVVVSARAAGRHPGTRRAAAGQVIVTLTIVR